MRHATHAAWSLPLVLFAALAFANARDPGETAADGEACSGVVERIYSRAFYTLIDVPEAWQRESRSGMTVYRPGPEGVRTARLLDDRGEQKPVAVPEGGCLLVTPHFLLASPKVFDLRQLEFSGAAAASLATRDEKIYADGTWSEATTGGCAGSFEWDANRNCFVSEEPGPDVRRGTHRVL